MSSCTTSGSGGGYSSPSPRASPRSEEHTSELQSQSNLVCRLLLEKKKIGSHEVSLLPAMLTLPSYSGHVRQLAHYLRQQARQAGLHACVHHSAIFIARPHPLPSG